MAADLPFHYNPLKPRQIRLFKLDLTDSVDFLSGSLVTVRHPCQLDTSMNNISQLLREWRDIQWIQKEDERHGYDALSYTWGDRQITHPLTLFSPDKAYKSGQIQLQNPTQGRGTVLIQHNLYTLLQQLRRNQYSRFIWIDAICINQEDDAEKSTQIPLMRYIYQEARCIFVWLGVASNIEEGALTILPALTRILEKTSQEGYKVNPEVPTTFDSVGLPMPDHEIWLALGGIMMRPWFRRLWTLQEVVLPRTYRFAPGSIKLMCGKKCLDWDTFNGFANAARAHGIENWTITGVVGTSNEALNGYHSLYMIDICHDAFKRFKWGVPPWILIVVVRWKEVSNPVDLIFGMLGLVPQGTSSQITVNVSLPVQTVFVEFAKYYIRNQVQECILNHTSAVTKLDGLPSWCPNFASREETYSLGSWWLGYFFLPASIADQKFHAGFELEGKWAMPMNKHKDWTVYKNSHHRRDIFQDVFNTDNPRQIALVPYTNYIRARGIAMEEVVEIIDCNAGMDYPLDNFPSFDQLRQTVQWEAACLALAKRTLKATSDIPDVYLRTLNANLVIREMEDDSQIWWDKGERINFLPEYQEVMKAHRTIVNHGALFSIPYTPMGRRYWSGVTRATRRRRFFATRNGRIGLGPSDTQIGDNVCVIFYCPTPYILRHGPTRSRLVGEAYVHDLMYSQALHLLDRGLVSESEWIIE